MSIKFKSSIKYIALFDGILFETSVHPDLWTNLRFKFFSYEKYKKVVSQLLINNERFFQRNYINYLRHPCIAKVSLYSTRNIVIFNGRFFATSVHPDIKFKIFSYEKYREALSQLFRTNERFLQLNYKNYLKYCNITGWTIWTNWYLPSPSHGNPNREVVLKSSTESSSQREQITQGQ